MPPQEQINELKARLDALEASTTIPFNTEQAFRERLDIDELALLETSTKDVADVTQAVNEGGTGTYDVATVPDGFRQWDLGGTVIYIPYYV